MSAAMDMLLGGGDKIKEMQKAMSDWYEKEGVPKLTDSFHHHDKDKSGVLENAEAKVFFLNLIQETETFTLALSQSVAQKQIVPTVQMMSAMMGKSEAKKVEKQLKEQVKVQLTAQKKDLVARVETYKKNKDERDEAAFKVMDTSEDGKIQLTEFLAMFNPDSDKQNELMVALGFMTEQEKALQAQMKQLANAGGMSALAGEGDEAPAECSTQ